MAEGDEVNVRSDSVDERDWTCSKTREAVDSNGVGGGGDGDTDDSFFDFLFGTGIGALPPKPKVLWRSPRAEE